MSLRALASIAVACVVASACDRPTIREYEPRSGVIRGTVLYPSSVGRADEPQARGNVIIFLFRAPPAEQPPPLGSARPVNFVVVPEAQLFGDAAPGVRRDFSAPFVIPTVAPGSYIIRAFLDADGDFNPLFDLTNQPTAGDVGGGYVSLATQRFLTLDVAADQVVEGSVVVTLAQPVTTERPAFAITSSVGVPVEAKTFSTPLRAPDRLHLAARPIARTQVVMDPARTTFLVRYADDDGDGAPDDANGDRLPDLYPRVLLRRLADGPSCTSTVVPLILDPSPFRDALAVGGSSLTPSLSLIVPPVAVSIAGGVRTVLDAIPPGAYEAVVISATGQTWIVPNPLDALQPGATDPTQSVRVRFEPGPAPPPGTIRGQLRVAAGVDADAYVFAFAEADPPPPLGTGRPVAAASVPRASFVGAGAESEAPFVLRGLPTGSYSVRAVADLDGDFSLLVPILQQPTAGDLVGGAAALANVVGAVPADAGTIRLTQALPFERPAFAIDGVVARLARVPAPQRVELVARPINALGMDASRTAFPVALSSPAADLDADKLRDLLPRVILTRLADGGDPRRAPDDPERIVIPALVDPVPFTAALSAGAPFVPATRLPVIVLPAAFRVGAAGLRTPVFPVPSGRYRVNVLSVTGQTWSVPSDVDTTFARIGTPLEDETQAGYVEILPTRVPLGGITGIARVPAANVTSDAAQLVILAFRADAPPPPVGSGRPVATALIQRADLSVEGADLRASYRLLGLESGAYVVRAFLDANGNATPWLETRNQPDGGDIAGGYFSGPALGRVEVDALAGLTVGIDVTISPALTVPIDRPVFAPPAGLVLRASNAPLVTALTALAPTTELLTATGTFLLQWSDLDGNGVADLGPTGEPALLPRVIAERLDPADPTRLAAPRVVIPGLVPPPATVPLGFPGDDPTNLAARLPVQGTLPVVFPFVALDTTTGQTITPPAGAYRVTVVNGSGQTWTVPNELARDPRFETQGRVLTVEP